MNQNRRKRLQEILDHIEGSKAELEDIRDIETGILENVPENLQGSSRYEAIEDTVSILDEAVDSFEILIENIESAMNGGT